MQQQIPTKLPLAITKPPVESSIKTATTATLQISTNTTIIFHGWELDHVNAD